ncbi:hypothetical protein [Actinacidiphila sp. bgisy167]|uniref:hypothetical protein n=1 Tax=Actinacidiphila sp. bgisy167 TaxID=3413797 RepID=UPI003D75D0D3
MVWCRVLRHLGLDALLVAARRLADEDGRLTPPDGAWLPEADARVMAPEALPRSQRSG